MMMDVTTMSAGMIVAMGIYRLAIFIRNIKADRKPSAG